jgi:hypothetical protein
MNRRQWLVGLGACTTLGMAAAAADPHPLRDLIRVIGREDGGLAVRWSDGVLSAHVDAEATPLFRVLSQIYSRHRRRVDGGYDTVVLELACFADLETREVLETWRNPYAGMTVPVAENRARADALRHSAEFHGRTRAAILWWRAVRTPVRLANDGR